MKRFLYPSLFVVVALLSTASMCNEDEKDEMPKQGLEASLSYGTWRVSYFFDKQDETSDFNGYSFQFNDDGIAIATKSSLSVQGSWNTEDSSNGNSKLYIDFGVGEPLEELNEDWVVVGNSGSKVTLEHVSGGNGDTDSLILERN
jgi:hypothetical protein